MRFVISVPFAVIPMQGGKISQNAWLHFLFDPDVVCADLYFAKL